jgi:rubrerythrin
MVKIYRTAVREGEDYSAAITRAASTASERGYTGYEIVCEKCGRRVDDHESPEDCNIWLAQLGKHSFEP